jgi:hypothetical protein
MPPLTSGVSDCIAPPNPEICGAYWVRAAHFVC